MQRQNLLRSRSPKRETSNSLDVALSKPDDEQLFYTASVHFLRKRLEEKKHRPSNPRDATQSCCNLRKPSTSESNCTVSENAGEKIESNTQIGKGSSLAMHQVLPFPKSSKDGFFARLKSTFQKYMRSDNDLAEPNRDEPETKCISNFKFPRCARLSQRHSSCLFKITEERSSENLREPPKDKLSRSSSKIVHLEEKKSAMSSKR
ncbi:uncharacterized protein LOC142986997 [Anticarsia gemmatalis]|uniref:uncharacterized protein LOC142986997 n=1 Tax=Anticarsia gemmatalis TaxID=129554 RepID=UPI003F77032A